MRFFDNDILDNIMTESYESTDSSIYTADAMGVANIVAESYEDQLEIVRAMHEADISELRCKTKYRSLRESGNDIDDEDEDDDIDAIHEAATENIFTKMKNAIVKLAQRVATFFRNLKYKLKDVDKSNKKFVDKYTPLLKESESTFPKEFKIDGYSGYAISTQYNGLVSSIKKYQGNSKTTLSKVQTKILSFIDQASKGEIKADVNKEDLEAMIANSKQAIFGSDVESSNGSISDFVIGSARATDKGSVTYTYAALIACLNSLSSAKYNDIFKVEDEAKKDFKDALDAISKAEKAAKKESEHKSVVVKVTKQYISVVTAMKSHILGAISATITAINEYISQTRRAVVKAISVSKKAAKSK